MFIKSILAFISLFIFQLSFCKHLVAADVPPKEETCLVPLVGHTDTIDYVSFSPDGTLVMTKSADKTVRLWNAHTGECIDALKGPAKETIFEALYSPKGTFIVIGSSNKIYILDACTRETIKILDDEERQLLAISPDEQLIAATSMYESFLEIVDLHTGTYRIVNNEKYYAIKSAVFSPDNRHLIIENYFDNTYYIIDIVTGESREIRFNNCFIKHFAFTPKAESFPSLLAYSYGEDTQAPEEWVQLEIQYKAPDVPDLTYYHYTHLGNKNYCKIDPIVFSPDGSKIAGNVLLKRPDFNHFIYVWDLGKKGCIRTLEIEHGVNQLAFNRNGTSIAITDSTNIVLIWNIGECKKSLVAI